MSKPTQKPFHELRIQPARAMWHTFYWIDQALQHHIREFEAQPELLAQFAAQAHNPIDVVARLEQLRQAASQLKRDLDRAKGHWKWLQDALNDKEPPFEELSPEQTAHLKRLDEQLNDVMQHIRQTAQAIDAPLAGPLADPANRLVDRNLDVKFAFILREDDLAHDDGDDNLVAEVDDSAGDPGEDPYFIWLDSSWPDGYDCTFPMPHGGLMHLLRLYDLTTGRWIKGRVRGEDPPGQPVYVRDA